MQVHHQAGCKRCRGRLVPYTIPFTHYGKKFYVGPRTRLSLREFTGRLAVAPRTATCQCVRHCVLLFARIECCCLAYEFGFVSSLFCRLFVVVQSVSSKCFRVRYQGLRVPCRHVVEIVVDYGAAPCTGVKMRGPYAWVPPSYWYANP